MGAEKLLLSENRQKLETPVFTWSQWTAINTKNEMLYGPVQHDE